MELDQMPTFLIDQFYGVKLQREGHTKLHGRMELLSVFIQTVRYLMVIKFKLAPMKLTPSLVLHLALIAVQELSFGSTKVRHLDAIDDVLIANNIANSANGEKTESYNYWWIWQDSATSDIRKSLSRLRSPDSSSVFGVFPSMNQDSFGGGDFPFSFFGCTNLCGADTSVENDGNQERRL